MAVSSSKCVLQVLQLLYSRDLSSDAFLRGKFSPYCLNHPLCLQESDVTADHAQVAVGVLTVIPDNSQQPGPNAPLHPQPSGTDIILDGNIIMDGIENLRQAVCLTFRLIYALHLDCPTKLKNIFDFIQRVLLSLGGGDLRLNLQSLKNALLQ